MSRVTMLIGLLAAASLAVAASSASAADGAAAPITVKGTQTVVNESLGKYTVQGDLLGSWNVTAFIPNYQGPDGQFVGSGKEVFTGCRDADRSGACDAAEPKGSIRFSFVYWATYDPKTKALVRGRCVHPVMGGTGPFKGIKGVIHMRDVPTKAGVRTTFTGTLAYDGSATPTTSSLVTRELASRIAGGGCGS
jgi:hypothetical protein